MEKIDSFKVNHLNLEPGIYESRRDNIHDEVIITYDLRITRPNREPVLNTAEIHTIEHLGATYLRNHPDFKDAIIYFGPMGCRTGFYLLIKNEENIFDLIYDLFRFIADADGSIPGASAHDCGNYLDHNLPMARYIALQYLSELETFRNKPFKYE